MSRRHAAKPKEVLPDAKFNNIVVAKLMNYAMVDGKKSVAETIVYDAFDLVEQKTKRDSLEVFEEAMDNIKPTIEVKSRRVGGATYQVPVEVSSRRRVMLALRWLIMFAKKRSEKRMSERLANELIDAANKRGGARKKSEDTFKMAEANKAFSHFRF